MQSETLRPLLDLPPVVQNSLLHAIGSVHQDISVVYHVAEAFENNIVRVLNMSTAEYQCATVRFVLASAIHVDYWNGDEQLGHPLCANLEFNAIASMKLRTLSGLKFFRSLLWPSDNQRSSTTQWPFELVLSRSRRTHIGSVSQGNHSAQRCYEPTRGNDA
jgi:hypothetical protein